MGDAAYNAGGGVLRPALGDDRAIGTELDLTTTVQHGRHLRWEVGYGRFWPGAFAKGSAAGAAASGWAYASTTVTF